MENKNKIYTAPRILIRLAVRLVKFFYLLICQQERREITKQQEIYPEQHRQVFAAKILYSRHCHGILDLLSSEKLLETRPTHYANSLGSHDSATVISGNIQVPRHINNFCWRQMCYPGVSL